MPDGHIRAYDSRASSGISEAHIFLPHNAAPSITTKGDHVKLLITDKKKNHQSTAKGSEEIVEVYERLLTALFNALL